MLRQPHGVFADVRVVVVQGVQHLGAFQRLQAVEGVQCVDRPSGDFDSAASFRSGATAALSCRW